MKLCTDQRPAATNKHYWTLIKHLFNYNNQKRDVYSLHTLLYFSYMFRYYIHHNDRELMCPLLKALCCYVAINCSFYSSYFINSKRYNSAFGIFHSGRNMTPGVDSASNRNEYQEYFRGVKVASTYGWQPYHLHVPTVMKAGSLNLLEPSGTVQGCTTVHVLELHYLYRG